MTDKTSQSHNAALEELEAALHAHRRNLGDDAVADGRTAARPRWLRRWRHALGSLRFTNPALRLRWPAMAAFWRAAGPKPVAAAKPAAADARPAAATAASHPPLQNRLSANLRGLWRVPAQFINTFRRRRIVRYTGMAVVCTTAIVLLVFGALWVRLSSGPILLDLATPWLTSAIEQNLGGRYRVAVGGTQLERDEQGRTALRLRDIVLTDAAGVRVAVAPKAEVGISGSSLLMASPRAESFRLVDAHVTVRIDADGQVNLMVGGERPIVTIAPDAQGTAISTTATPAPPRPGTAQPPASAARDGTSPFKAWSERDFAGNLTALLGWIDEAGKIGFDPERSGFDGGALNDVGIANGSLTIDDRRGGSEWTLSAISLNLSRLRQGGARLTVLSESQQRPWSLTAALSPMPQGHRRLQFEARKVVLDDLLALRILSSAKLRSDTRISAQIDADIDGEGLPVTLNGSVSAEGGSIGAPEEPEAQIPITSAEVGIDWSAQRRTLRVPFKVQAGAARYTLRAEFAAPAQAGEGWAFAVGGGWIVLDPLGPDDEGLVLRRVVVRGNVDPTAQRITIEQGDLGTKEIGLGRNDGVTVAMSGRVDYAGEGKLVLGIACNPMPVAAFKRLWPAFLAPKVRDWVIEHITAGNVERVDIATNVALNAIHTGGPPIPDDGLYIEVVGSNAVLRAVEGLPPIREADLVLRMNGRNAKVTIGRGSVEVSPGKRLLLSNGVLEVPSIRVKQPPAKVSFRVEGPIPAVAELLQSERLRDFAGAPFDPAGTRGNVAGQVQLSMALRPDLPPGSTEYDISVDLANLVAEKAVMGQRLEAQLLRVNANNQGYEIKGDVKVGGAPAQIEYRKAKGDAEAEVRLTTVLDESTRTRFGLDVGPALAGPMPIKVTGRLGTEEREPRFGVEADLASNRIDNLLPGWNKQPGRPAKASFTVVKPKSGGTRLEDVLVDGQGVLAKGSVELDGNNELLAANFPVFATSDGDKASVRVDRGADGALRVVARGDVYDGRGFIKAAMAGPTDQKIKARYPDLDLDIKFGVVAGHYGEALRGLDWRMSRRAGRIRTFSLGAKVGRDTPLIGDIRTRPNGKPVIYLETGDAGALFRFTDMYQRMVGGKMWVSMDPPTQDSSPQDGVINVANFSIRGENTLDRVVSNAPTGPSNNIEFSQARADFTRASGRLLVKDGVLRGPMIGATVEGNVDYARDQVMMRGTLVPLYGINNMFGQIPIVGLFLGGGGNEGLFGITYEVGGTTANPRTLVNPISAIAPGVLRKFFEFRDVQGNDRSYADPTTR